MFIIISLYDVFFYNSNYYLFFKIGTHCDENIDDCINCNTVGTNECVDLVDDYRCHCNAGYGGIYCNVRFHCNILLLIFMFLYLLYALYVAYSKDVMECIHKFSFFFLHTHTDTIIYNTIYILYIYIFSFYIHTLTNKYI